MGAHAHDEVPSGGSVSLDTVPVEGDAARERVEAYRVQIEGWPAGIGVTR